MEGIEEIYQHKNIILGSSTPQLIFQKAAYNYERRCAWFSEIDRYFDLILFELRSAYGRY